MLSLCPAISRTNRALQQHSLLVDIPDDEKERFPARYTTNEEVRVELQAKDDNYKPTPNPDRFPVPKEYAMHLLKRNQKVQNSDSNLIGLCYYCSLSLTLAQTCSCFVQSCCWCRLSDLCILLLQHGLVVQVPRFLLPPSHPQHIPPHVVACSMLYQGGWDEDSTPNVMKHLDGQSDNLI